MGILDSSGWAESTSSVSIVNTSDNTASSLSKSNLAKSVGLGFSLANSMDTIASKMGVDSRDSSMNSRDMRVDSWDMGILDSSGWAESTSSVSIVNTSDNTASSLSKSNLAKSVGLGFSLAIGMNTIRITRVHSS